MVDDRCHVLLVENVEHIRDEILRNLNTSNYAVTTVLDDEQAISTQQQEHFDIILLGIDRLEPNSVKLISQFKANPVWQRSPIILIATDQAADLVMTHVTAGADDYLLPPFDQTRLEKRILINTHRARTQEAKIETMLRNSESIRQVLIENDLKIGRQIQQEFLPTTFPDLPGWEIGSSFQAAREVAGDFYDAFEMPNNRLGLLIADVCDKGVGAALFMSLMRSLIRAYAMQNYSLDWSRVINSAERMSRKRPTPSPRQAMPSAGRVALENAIKLTNDYVATIHSDLNMFATTFFGILQPTTGRLLYINGGHCPPLLLDAHGNVRQRLAATGPAVGMFADAPFEISEVILEPEDTLLMFTDGVSDARNLNKTPFTEDRLIALVQEPFASVGELLRRVESAVTHFIGDADQFDDITMLAIRRQAKA